jgi:hypothetical protein
MHQMLTLKIDSQAHLTGHLPDGVADRIKARLTFPTPAYLEAQKRGFATWNTPQKLSFLEEEGDALIIPRGFTRQLIGILKNAGVQYRLEDRRRTLHPVDFTFTGQLRDFQVEAVEAMAARDFGTLAAPTRQRQDGCGPGSGPASR